MVCFCRSAEEMLQPVDLNLINDLWVPNVFIYNLKTFKVGTRQKPVAFYASYSKYAQGKKQRIFCDAIRALILR